MVLNITLIKTVPGYVYLFEVTNHKIFCAKWRFEIFFKIMLKAKFKKEIHVIQVRYDVENMCSLYVFC